MEAYLPYETKLRAKEEGSSYTGKSCVVDAEPSTRNLELNARDPEFSPRNTVLSLRNPELSNGKPENLFPTSEYRARDREDNGRQWTEIEHENFLNQMEAEFVVQMYESQYCHLDICGRSPDMLPRGSCSSCGEDVGESTTWSNQRADSKKSNEKLCQQCNTLDDAVAAIESDVAEQDVVEQSMDGHDLNACPVEVTKELTVNVDTEDVKRKNEKSSGVPSLWLRRFQGQRYNNHPDDTVQAEMAYELECVREGRRPKQGAALGVGRDLNVCPRVESQREDVVNDNDSASRGLNPCTTMKLGQYPGWLVTKRQKSVKEELMEAESQMEQEYEASPNLNAKWERMFSAGASSSGGDAIVTLNLFRQDAPVASEIELTPAGDRPDEAHAAAARSEDFNLGGRLYEHERDGDGAGRTLEQSAAGGGRREGKRERTSDELDPSVRRGEGDKWEVPTAGNGFVRGIGTFGSQMGDQDREQGDARRDVTGESAELIPERRQRATHQRQRQLLHFPDVSGEVFSRRRPSRKRAASSEDQMVPSA